jgi:hypothetical protein
MENIKSLREEFVAKLAENNIVKKTQIGLPVAMILAGAVIFFLPLSGLLPIKFIQPCVASLVLLAGIVLLLKAPKYQYTTTQKGVVSARKYYSSDDKAYLLNCLAGRVDKNYTVSKNNVRNDILLEMYRSTDGNFLAAQFSQYVPYEYQLLTAPCFFHGEQAQQLNHALL